MFVVGRFLLAATTIALLAGNAVLCWRMCATKESYSSPWPFLTDDHSLHYANAVATRHHLAHSATNAGYDPYFMAGYAKSSIWPSNPLLEIVVFALPFFDSAQVFKHYVWLSAATVPFALLYAGWRLRLSLGVILLATTFWVLQYWAGFPFHTFQYVQFGMAAFVHSIALLLVAGAALQNWLRERTWWAAVEMGAFAGLALTAHGTAGLLLGVPAAVAFLVHGFWRSRQSIGQAIFACGLAAALNYWWLAPLFTLRGTFGDSPGYFNNPNVAERLTDLFQPAPNVAFFVAPPLIGVLLLFAVGNGVRLGIAWPIACIWLFLLAFPAGALEQLQALQVGRNTLHLQAWLCLPSASAIAAAWRGLPKALRIPTFVALAWCSVSAVAIPGKVLGDMFARKTAASTAELERFPQLRRLLDELKRRKADGRRVLFEVFEDRSRDAASNPFGSLRLAPLIPEFSGLEVVGGPYLMTHYTTNFTNCGEGTFVGEQRWDRKEAEDYLQLYALDLAVFWSRPALAFAATNKDLFEPVQSFRDIHLFRIRRAKAPWESAGLRIAATFNRIVVENPQRAKGRFVLPYHATPGWSVEPNCRLLSSRQLGDPVPFLTLVDPPDRVALTFSPWTLSGPPPEQ